MSSLTNTVYTATQYALFGTLWSLPAKTIASQWGAIVDAWGYGPFFVYTAAIGLPALLLVSGRSGASLCLNRRRAPRNDGCATIGQSCLY